MMNRYLRIVCSVIFIGLIALPCQILAANITPTSAALGEGCEATGYYSTAMGCGTTASGPNSTAMGCGTTASGSSSTAMGESTTASGEYSTAMGYVTTASGYLSTAMGFNTTASGDNSTAMGHHTEAANWHSTVIGYSSSPSHKLTNNIENSFMVGYMADESDTTPEFFVKDGAVGINTSNPTTWFHVKGAKSGSPIVNNHVAAIVNTSSNTNPNVLMLKVDIDNPTTESNFITFRDNSGNIGSIEGNGSGGIQLNTSGADFAEYLPKAEPSETLTPRDIVGLFPGGVSKKTDGAQRIMVVSTAPAVVGNQPKEEHGSRYVPVSFLGQAPVRVEGAVRSGDYIVPSGRGDGVGRAVSPADLTPAQYGNTVGRAIQSSSEKGMNCVTVLVGLPQNELWETAMAAKDARIARLEGRLAALEAKTEVAANPSLLPGAGIIMGSLGLIWMGRRRRRPCTQNPAAEGNL